MNATGFDTDELRKIMNTICEEVNREVKEEIVFGDNKYDQRVKVHVERLTDAVVRKLQVYADLGSFEVDPKDVQVFMSYQSHPPHYWRERSETSFVVNVIGRTAKKFMGE